MGSDSIMCLFHLAVEGMLGQDPLASKAGVDLFRFGYQIERALAILMGLRGKHSGRVRPPFDASVSSVERRRGLERVG